MSEVEETLKRINSHKGVQGIVIVNQDCIPIRSTLDEKMSKALATDITQLCGRARSAVRSLDPQNDLTFLRIRSKKYEILVAPDKVRAVAEHSSSSSPLCLCSSRSPSATAAAAAAVATLGPLRMLRAWLPLGRPCRCSRHHRAQSSLSLALRARVLSMFCAFSRIRISRWWWCRTRMPRRKRVGESSRAGAARIGIGASPDESLASRVARAVYVPRSVHARHTRASLRGGFVRLVQD